jgi:hypothetical protein
VTGKPVLAGRIQSKKSSLEGNLMNVFRFFERESHVSPKIFGKSNVCRQSDDLVRFDK